MHGGGDVARRAPGCNTQHRGPATHAALRLMAARVCLSDPDPEIRILPYAAEGFEDCVNIGGTVLLTTQTC
jgi:hypothetical protein